MKQITFQNYCEPKKDIPTITVDMSLFYTASGNRCCNVYYDHFTMPNANMLQNRKR